MNHTTLENPNTPMAYLKPSLAIKVTNLTYGVVGSLAVLLWDVILHLPQDYRLATQFRINFSFILYSIARLSTLAYVFGVVLMTTLPVGHCDALRQLSILSPFSIPLSVLPFVMRVSALYSNNKYVVTFFSMAWLGVLGSYIAATIGTTGAQIGNTMYCIVLRTKTANALTSSSVFILDSLVFIATSWALMRNSYSDVTMKNSISVMAFGRYLPAFSKSILRDGQAYFLATLILNFLFVVLCYIPKAPIAPCAIGFPFFVMLNNMSSYVYRNLRFQFYQDHSITSSAINEVMQRRHTVVFDHRTSTRSEEKSEAGDSTTNIKGLLAQATEKQKMEV